MPLVKSIRYNKLFAIIILLGAFTVLSPTLDKAYLYIITPFFFFISLLFVSKSIFNNGLLRLYILFTLSFLLTSLFGIDVANSLSSTPFYINTLLVVVYTTVFSQNPKYQNVFFGFYLLYFIACWIYGYQNAGFSEIDITSERAGDDSINANRFGYFLFFLTFLCYVKGERFNKYASVWRFLFLLIPFISFAISLITASRQILIIQIPFIAVLIFLRYFNKLTYKSLILGVLFTLLLIIGLVYIRSSHSDAYLLNRMSEDFSEDSRVELMLLAINVFFQKPLTGVGIGNLGFMSHCTYTDILAEAGIIPFVLYLSVLISFCRRLYIRYIHTHQSIFLAFLTFGIFYIIYNIFYVFYLFAIVMAFIFLAEQYSTYIYRIKMLKV